MEDWYSITQKDLKDQGVELLQIFRGSLSKLVMSVYPEYPLGDMEIYPVSLETWKHLNKSQRIELILGWQLESTIKNIKIGIEFLENKLLS